MAHDNDDEDAAREWQRSLQADRAQREQDSFTMLIFGAAVLLLGVGGAGLWSLWVYLQDGNWPTHTLRTVLGWSFASDMLGWQNIVNWFLDQWIGVYPLAFGSLTIWASQANT